MKLSAPRLISGLSFALAPLAALSLLFLVPGSVFMPLPAQAQAVDDSEEILTRGPVHEAFAATISFKATPGISVPKAPPAAIEELPPDQRPEGANITWIPGYWAWDEDSIGFIWVSGIWRNVPPGRQWMPGYWSESGQEYQWISGYWADEAVEEVEYLAAPPASLEAGPNSEAPSRNHTWIPGNWRWRGSDYAWQGGYWNEVQPDWVWMPSYYTSTPRGYLYVDGYYDYDMPRRGLLFAPVRFQGDRWSQADYSYRPSVVISIGAMLDHLFLRPRSRHYYFGDYYGAEYRRSGYYPSYNYYSGGHGYDPIYAHERWSHRDDSGWNSRNADNFAFYRDHQDERPPRTFAAFAGFLSRPDRNRRVEPGFASRLDDYTQRKDSKVRFKALDDGEKQRFSRNERELGTSAETRKNDGKRGRGQDGADGEGRGEGKAGEGPRQQGPSKSKALKSPVAAVRNPEGGRGEQPPQRPTTSRADEGPKGNKEAPGGPGRKNGAKDGPPPDNKPKPERTSPNQEKPEKDTQPRNRPDARDPKDTPKKKPNAEPRPEAPRKDSQPKGNSKDRPAPERKDTPRQEPPQQKPKAEPKRAPKPDKKAEAPRLEPRSEPKREPQPKPKAAPRREAPPQVPKSQPKREPRRDAPIPPEEKRQPKAPPQPQQTPNAPKKGNKSVNGEEDRANKKAKKAKP